MNFQPYTGNSSGSILVPDGTGEEWGCGGWAKPRKKHESEKRRGEV